MIRFILLFWGVILTWPTGAGAAENSMASAGFLEIPEKPMAPPFAMPDLAGNTVSLSDVRGNNVLLFFWATW